MGKHHNPFVGFDDDDESVRGDEPEGADFQVEQVLQERDKAIQVVLAETGDIKWIPKSVIHIDSEVYEKPDVGNGAGKLVIHTWFAEQEDML